jgi:uncharacterized protein
VSRGWFASVEGDAALITSRPVRWGLGDAALGLLLAQAVSLVATLAVFAALGYLDDPGFTADDLSLETIAFLQMFLWGGYGGVALYSASRKGNGPVLDLGWKFRWPDLYQGLIIGVGTQWAAGIMYALMFLFLPEQDVSEAARNLTDRASGFGILALLFVVVVGAPVIEELFFRGLLLRSLQRRFGAWSAIVISSLVFAVVHLQLLQFPALFLFGFVAGWLTIRSGRLGPAIWAHVAFNSWTVAILLLVS